MAEKGSLIPDDAQRLLEQQDAERAKARAKLPVGTRAYDQFRNNFITNHADQIRLMQRGAIVTSTVADEKRRRGIPVTDWLDEERPYTVEIPDGKPAETLVQARRVIWWAKVKRAFRTFIRRGPHFITINEGGRGVTFSSVRPGMPFRLYVAGWVLMLNMGKWSFRRYGR